MNKLYSFCIVSLLALCCSSTVVAQTLSVYNVDYSAFPKITASYLAFDANGQPYTGLQGTDFRVEETAAGGGVTPLSSTIIHDCKTTTTDPEASIIIVVDRSYSMDQVVEGTNTKRWDYTRNAINAFVNKIKFTGETRVAVLGFAGNLELFNDWGDKPGPIRDTLQRKNPIGGTDYREPFASPGINIYEMFAKRPANIPRYVFFLTDGHPSPEPDNMARFIDTNSTKMSSLGIKFFGVTILQPAAHESLIEFARRTGGKSIVARETELVDLFSVLATETQQRSLCTISWISPYVCSEAARNRTAVIAFVKPTNQPKVTVTYTTPPNSLARASVSAPVLYVGNPTPNNIATADITIKAESGPLTITSGSVNPPGAFSVISWNLPAIDPNGPTQANPIILQQGQSRSLRIQFLQGNEQIFRQAQLAFVGTPCPPAATLVGGAGKVILQTPDGGEVFSTCDTVIIKWLGVLPSQPVVLEYSETGEEPWTMIKNNATGLSYKWLPPAPGNSYRVRVSYNPVPGYTWVTQGGASGADTATSVAVDATGSRIVATGYVDGPTQFGTFVHNSTVGNIDGYMAYVDSDGKIIKLIILSGNGNTEEKIIGAVIDSKGFLTLAGYTTSANASLGTLGNIQRESRDTKNMFICRLDPAGNLVWLNYSKGTPTISSSADARKVGWRLNASGQVEVIVTGTFLRYANFGNDAFGGAQVLSVANNATNNYYTVYNENGNCIDKQQAAPPAVYTYAQMKDTVDGFQYETGTFSGAKVFTPPNRALGAAGPSDVFVSKYGAPPPSSAQSARFFTISAPVLSASVSSVSFTATAVGRDNSALATGLICNDGDFPVTIDSVKFTGANPGDFVLVGDPRGQVLRGKPNRECATFEFRFAPTAIGNRSCTFTVYGSCNTQASTTLTGNGLATCSYQHKTLEDLGRIAVGTTPTIKAFRVLKNTGLDTLKGRLSVSGSPDISVAEAGSLIKLAPNDSLNVTLTINASTPGTRVVTLDYGLAAECNSPQTVIQVFAVEPRVVIDSVDFGARRVKTVNQGTLRMINLNSDPVRITSIQNSDINNQHITPTLFTPPITIPANDTVRIPVRYIPQSRGLHTLLITAAAEGQTAPIVGEVRGIGVLPAIDANGYAFGPCRVLLPSPDVNGRVVIRNTDATTELKINNVSFQTVQQDFTWRAGAMPTFPYYIPRNDSLVIPVDFTPQTQGLRSVNVDIVHDAVEGPEPISLATTTVVVTGSGVDPSELNPIDFGSILSCETRSISFEIPNDLQTPLVIDSIEIVGTPSPAFKISESGAFVVAPGAKRTITITFTPGAPGSYSIAYRFANNQQLKLNMLATGVATTVQASFTIPALPKVGIGDVVTIPVVLTAPALPSGIIFEPVTFTLNFNDKFFRYKGLTPNTAPNWDFIGNVTAPGILTVVGTPNVGAQFTSGTFFNAQLDLFITADSSQSFTVDATTNLSCLILSGGSNSIAIELGCFPSGRLIDLSATNFALQLPKPNPAAEITTISYSTGITVSTVFEVIDKLGNIVYSYTTPELASGNYEFDLRVAELATGLYTLRMTSGPFSGTTTVVVHR